MYIVYPDGIGSFVLLSPTGQIPIAEVGRKDVPPGVPYIIVETEPTTTPDFSNPIGHGASYGVGTDWAVIGYDTNLTAALVSRTNEQGIIEHAFVNGFNPTISHIVEVT